MTISGDNVSIGAIVNGRLQFTGADGSPDPQTWDASGLVVAFGQGGQLVAPFSGTTS